MVAHPPAHGAGTHPRKETTLAASKRPSFLKRQKEQARLARAAEKRSARAERKVARASGELGDDMMISDSDAAALMGLDDPDDTDTDNDSEDAGR